MLKVKPCLKSNYFSSFWKIAVLQLDCLLFQPVVGPCKASAGHHGDLSYCPRGTGHTEHNALLNQSLDGLQGLE